MFTPQHIAIIMDGNGRWASTQGLSRLEGHAAGSEVAKNVIHIALKHNIKHLTLYAFSLENWYREEDEVNHMMYLMEHYIDSEMEYLKKNQIKTMILGDREKFSTRLQEKISLLESSTAPNSKMHLYIAASYSGKQEIIHMAQKISKLSIEADKINEDLIKKCLYSNMPDVDLLIRTGGEQRLSNFLPWHLSYSELLFLKKYWPDFNESDFLDAINEFKKRKRKFGKVE